MVKNMKQNRAPVAPTNPIVMVTSTLKEKVEVLTDSTMDAVMKMKEKTTFLVKFFELQNPILESCKKADRLLAARMGKDGSSLKPASNFEETMRNSLPKTKNDTTKHKNEGLARKIIQLSAPCIALLEFEESEKKLRPSTRHSTETTPTIGQAVFNLMVEMKILMDDVEEKCQKARIKKVKIPKQPTLKKDQMNMLWDPKKVPSDPVERVCAFCNHYSICEPNENATVVERNDEQANQYAEQKRLWEKHVEDKKR